MIEEAAHEYVQSRYGDQDEISIDDILGVYEAYKDGYKAGLETYGRFISGIVCGILGCFMACLILYDLNIIKF